MALTALLTVMSCLAFATVSKEKKINGSHNVQLTDKLTIENTTGLVHVNTWDKNEVTVNITIKVKGKNEEEADELLKGITIATTGTTEHNIVYKTELTMPHNVSKATVSVEYVVNMPRKMAMDVTHKYGNVFVDDFEGKMKLTVSYGALNTKKITGADKNIKVSYGSGNIAGLEAGNLDVSYSAFTVGNAGALFVKNKYGKLNIDKISDLKIDQKYGDVELGEVTAISGEIAYAGLAIEQLRKSATLNLKYCGKADFKSVLAGVDNINITAKYGSLYFKCDERNDLGVDLDIEYGDLDNRSGVVKSLDLSGKPDAQTRYYKGRIGKGLGKMILMVKYGSVTFK